MGVTGANVVQIAAPFIWLGMVLVISFAVVELALAGVLTAALVLRGGRTSDVIILTSLLSTGAWSPASSSGRSSSTSRGVDLAVDPLVRCGSWQTVLLHVGPYRRNALRPHVDLTARIDVDPAYFTRWLSLWTAVVDERHTGGTAELAKVQVACIASAISRGPHGRSLGEVPTIGISPSDRRSP